MSPKPGTDGPMAPWSLLKTKHTVYLVSGVQLVAVFDRTMEVEAEMILRLIHEAHAA